MCCLEIRSKLMTWVGHVIPKATSTCAWPFLSISSTALWACTSECKILGHSDRCWSPSAVRANAAPSPSPAPALTLSSFGTLPKTASLPRDPNRRENYYQAHIPKTVGLQSVYEKVLHREYDYVMVTPPRPARMEEIGEVAIPVYTPSPSRRSNTEAWKRVSDLEWRDYGVCSHTVHEVYIYKLQIWGKDNYIYIYISALAKIVGTLATHSL